MHRLVSFSCVGTYVRADISRKEATEGPKSRPSSAQDDSNDAPPKSKAKPKQKAATKPSKSKVKASSEDEDDPPPRAKNLPKSKGSKRSAPLHSDEDDVPPALNKLAKPKAPPPPKESDDDTPPHFKSSSTTHVLPKPPMPLDNLPAPKKKATKKPVKPQASPPDSDDDLPVTQLKAKLTKSKPIVRPKAKASASSKKPPAEESNADDNDRPVKTVKKRAVKKKAGEIPIDLVVENSDDDAPLTLKPRSSASHKTITSKPKPAPKRTTKRAVKVSDNNERATLDKVVDREVEEAEKPRGADSKSKGRKRKAVVHQSGDEDDDV